MERNAYDTASWWGVLTFGWLTPTLERGAQEPLRTAPPLPDRDNSVLNGAGFVNASENSDAMIRKLVWHYRWSIALLQLGFIIQHAIGLSSPLILKHILVFQEANNKKAAVQSDLVTTGIFAIQLYIVLELVRIVLNTQVGFLQARVHLRMKAALFGVVLDRSLHRAGSDEQASKGGSGSDGGIYNVLEYDTEVHIQSVFVIMQAWLWPFNITTAAFLLYREIGASAYPGVVAMCILQVIYLCLNTATAMSRGPYLSAKDERIARLSETLQHVRSVRVNNWRDPMVRHVGDGRNKEMNWLSFREYAISIDGALHYAHGTIIALVVFWYFIRTPGQAFKASVVLPVLGLLSQVNGPIGALPNWIKTYIEYRNGSSRMVEYLACTKRFPPADDAPVEELVAVNAEFRYGDVRPGAADEETLLPGFTLRANLRVRTGEVVVLTGPPGSGKTMFLNAILGEVPKLRGVVHAPRSGPTAASREPVAAVTAHALHTGSQPVTYPTAAITFCAQVPWVFPGTAEENILYGTRKDEDLYSRVVAACALEPDFELFADGDRTEVAASTISGGQRTRLALARAVYRALAGPARPVLVMLDDPLRSVDEKVGRHIAQHLLGSDGLLRRPNIGVLLACADVPPGVGCRKFQMAAGSIVDEQLLDGDDVVGGDNAQDGSGGAVPSALLTPKYSNPQDIDRRPPTPPLQGQREADKRNALSLTSPGEEQKTVGKKQLMSTLSLYAEEKSARGMVALSTYVRYAALVGNRSMTLILISIGGIMISQQCVDLFLAYWTDENQAENFLHPYLTESVWTYSPILSGKETPYQMYNVYFYLCVVFIAFNFSGFLLEVWGGLRAARSTFNHGLIGCLRRPLVWWDTNPTGRVLNRFQTDQNVIDQTITRIIGVITGAVYYFIGRTVFLGMVNPIAIVVLFPTIAALEYYAARLYRPNLRELQRLVLVSKSPFYNTIVESLRGQLTVRAFGAQGAQVQALMVAWSHVQKVAFLQFSLNQWLAVRLASISFLLSITSTIYPVFQYFGFLPPQSAGMIGFAMMYSQQLEGILSQLIHNWSELETQMVSLERLAELADAPEDTLLPMPPAPAGAKDLQVQELSVRYRAELPLALRNVSFTVRAGEKVAVVGRTGSGKSSLLLCLLGQVPYEGVIRLGGQRTAGHRASDRVGLVPQDAVLFRGTLRFNLDPAGAYADSALWAALRAAGLAARADELREDGQAGLDVRIGDGGVALSNAEAQQLGIARVLLRDYDVVLLDEVTSCLGPSMADRLLSLIWQALEAKTVLMVTHQLELVHWCSRSIVIDRGTVVHDAPVVA